MGEHGSRKVSKEHIKLQKVQQQYNKQVGHKPAPKSESEDPAYTVDQKAYTHYLRSLETHMKENSNNYMKTHTWAYKHQTTGASDNKRSFHAGGTQPLWSGRG